MAGVRLKSPAHPGGFIKHEIIEPLGLSVTAAAEVLGVTRATLSTLLNERAPFAGNGAAHGKGVRRVHGHADADAKQLRHRPARKREGEIKVMPFTGKPLEPHAVA
jgi:hypothetical protein